MRYIMSDVVTPKKILEDLVRDLSHQPYMSTLDRWTLRIMIVTVSGYVSTVIIAVVLKFFGITSPWIAVVVIMLTFVVVCVNVVLSLISTISGVLKRFRHPERTELEQMTREFNNELALVTHLVRTYERRLLEYGHERVTLEIAHIRSWNAVWFRPLEQVGVVPLAVAGYLAYLVSPQLQASSRLIPGVLDVWIIGGVLLFFYVLGMHRHLACQCLDRFSLVLKYAVQAKTLADTSTP